MPEIRAGRKLTYKAFLRAMRGTPVVDGPKARLLWESAVAEGITSASEARRLFIQTRRADLEEKIRAKVKDLVAQRHEGPGQVPEKALLFGPDGRPL